MLNPTIYQATPEFYHTYLNYVETDDLMAELETSRDLTLAYFRELPQDKEDYRYEAGKWSPKEVLRHINETERIFTYRALRFSRFDDSELAGFEQNSYIENIAQVEFPLEDLVEEFDAIRKATISLFKPMTKSMLDFLGIASQNSISTQALGCITVGHCLHHLRILKERYV